MTLSANAMAPVRHVSSAGVAAAIDAQTRRYSRALRELAYGLLLISAAVACVAAIQAEPWIVSLASALAAAGLAASDIARSRLGGISPITLYALAACTTECANVVGLLASDTVTRSLYFLYAVDEHLLLASWLSFAGTVLPVLGFFVLTRDPGWERMLTWLPSVSGRVTFRHLTIGGTALAIGVVGLRWLRLIPNLGTVTAVLLEMPNIITFVLARAAAQSGRYRMLWLALVIAGLESARALFLDFLRGNMIAPFVAFVLGALLGSRSLALLRTRFFLPVYAAAIVFVAYFGAFGQARASAAGLERVMRTIELEGVPEGYVLQASQRQNVVGRLTNFNQLSQIGRLVEEDGFYGGSTLEYLGTAFIPRFLWPDKPLIAKGSWFAVRIGQGYIKPDGLSNNSVNMTVPGELYLNFGWLGVFIGCLIFGAIIAILWLRTNFWTDSQNTFGAAFGFFLFWFAIWLGIDLQVLVTLVAMYLTLSFAGLAYRSAFQTPQASPSTRRHRYPASTRAQ